jgi:hypothetical protein
MSTTSVSEYKGFVTTNIMLTIVKAQMLNKPYIHYIDVKIMNMSAVQCFYDSKHYILL